jgi:hypothetical protein
MSYAARTPIAGDPNGSITSWRGAYPRFDVQVDRTLTRTMSLNASVRNVLKGASVPSGRDTRAGWCLSG